MIFLAYDRTKFSDSQRGGMNLYWKEGGAGRSLVAHSKFGEIVVEADGGSQRTER